MWECSIDVSVGTGLQNSLFFNGYGFLYLSLSVPKKSFLDECEDFLNRVFFQLKFSKCSSGTALQ